ncbi:MAG: ABC transporter substrate-binding protein [Chloroflexi bacterium]|nr:ABC transporter substrate-binding protein [Chloroflexota bacterium]
MRARITRLSITVLLGLFAFACTSALPPTPVPAPPKAAAPAVATTAPAAPAPKAAATPAAAAPTSAPKAAAPAKPKTLTKVKAAYAAVSGNTVPTWIAADEKLFEKYGLDVELSYIASGTTATQAMVSGDVPLLAPVNGTAVMSAKLAGSDATIIGITFNTAIFYLMVTPDINSPSDLKGKSLGITRFGSLTDFAVRFALRKMGLEPEKDVAILQMGGVPEILSAMQTGAIAGGPLSSPTDLRARDAGMKELMDIGAQGLQYPGTAIATTQTFIRNNRDTVLNFIRAKLEGTYLFKTNKELSMKVLGKYTKTEDRKVLEGTWEAYSKKTEKIPYATKEAMLAGIEELAASIPKAREANPDSFLDMQFVKQLEDSGFIKQLYKD